MQRQDVLRFMYNKFDYRTWFSFFPKIVDHWETLAVSQTADTSQYLLVLQKTFITTPSLKIHLGSICSWLFQQLNGCGYILHWNEHCQWLAMNSSKWKHLRYYMFIPNHNRKRFSLYCRYDTSILCTGVILYGQTACKSMRWKNYRESETSFRTSMEWSA